MERDTALNILSIKEDSLGQGSLYSTTMRRDSGGYFDEAAGTGRRRGRAHGAVGRWLDTFRRDPDQRMTPKSVSSALGLPTRAHRSGHYFDLQGANFATANSGLSRELKGRHLQMIAIGGSIGTGLFVASGKALNLGGPASVLIAYGFIGMMLYCTVHALGELAVTFPVAGSFSAFSTRFLDPSWGFAMGWK